METLEEKKKEVIQKLMAVKSQKTLDEVDRLLGEEIARQDDTKSHLADFVGVLTSAEASQWRTVIAATSEKIEPDDWR